MIITDISYRWICRCLAGDIAEALGSGRILSIDQRDFRAYRGKNRKPFKNLLLFDR